MSSRLFRAIGLLCPGKLKKMNHPLLILQRILPGATVLQHYFPQQPNLRHAVVKHFIMEFFEREIRPFLFFIVRPQFHELQFPDGIKQITRIKRTP